MYFRLTMGLFALSALLSPARLALAQDGRTKPVKPRPQTGHVEVPDDPFVKVPRAQQPTTPGGRFERNGYVSVQVNVDADGNNIVGDAANEPSIAVDPTNPNRMVIGWRQFDTINSNFRQAGYGYTTDGGQTWTFPGKIEPGVFRSDPVLDVDSEGTFYYNSLTASGYDFWCHVFRSTDGGATWDNGTYAYGGDKQWMVIDRTGGIGDGNIYANWTQYWSTCYPGHFTRSTNGGNSYESCTQIPNNPYWGTMAIGPDGELYVCGDGFIVAKSTNAQDPNQAVQWDFTRSVNLGGSMGFGGGPNPDGLLGQVWVAVDRSEGPSRGNVYLLCSVDPPGADPLDVMFARSTDGGNTWSNPVRVNDDQGSAWQWFGTMSVAPNGRIDAVWNDTRNDPGGYDSQLYYAYSLDAGQTWSENVAITPPWNPHIGWPQQNKIGDYYDMVSDDAGARVAFAATFNGEHDVYFVYITTTRPLSISFPDGLPEYLTPGQPADIAVRINPGDEQYIPDSGTLYYRYDGGTFQTAPLVPQGGELYTATLPAARCDDTPEFYFSAEGSDSGVVYSPPGAPGETYAATVGEFITAFAEDLSANPGWSVQGQWAYGQPTGGGGEYGGPDPTSGHTGPNVYGYNLYGDYENYLPERHLTTTAIDCTGLENVHLRFWRWLGVEQPAYDHAYIRASNNGTNWTTVWQNTSEITDYAWTQMDVDISAVADDQPTVYLRWTMGPTDGGWRYCGWNIDDVELVAFVCEEGCAGDLDGDGDTDQSDLGILLGDWGCTGGNCAGDLDGDGDTDQSDLGILLGDWGCGA